ncbi:hypothetical protein NDU88_001890 [Pleurodeles waltl]|uniref:Uncharacterized protein n=1 Tax=Pleurodeles waltl TaxID=8319 RepID=A0AAV7U7S7_PLEWA|nr:hypothetical protein NDU88_001890 [Pleurodeles waltl]
MGCGGLSQAPGAAGAEPRVRPGRDKKTCGLKKRGSGRKRRAYSCPLQMWGARAGSWCPQRALLQGHDGRALEAQVGLDVVRDLPHQVLEGQLVDEQLIGLLETADLPESHGPRPLVGHDGRALEAQVGLNVVRDLPHQVLEGQLVDEQLVGLLETADLPESHGPGPLVVRLLDSPGGRRALAGSLGGQLLARRFPSGGLAGGLLGVGHGEDKAFSVRRC